MDVELSGTVFKLSPFWQWYLTVLVFCWGACWGSFLNVCIHRIPRDLSLSFPGSHCPRCGKAIAWYDNLPLLSFLILRARCRWCGTKISCRYFLVELLTAILFVLIWFKLGPVPGPRLLGLAPITSFALVLIYWLAITGLIIGTFVDFEHFIIPDRITWGGIVAGLILSTLFPILQIPEAWPDKVPMLEGLWLSAQGAVLGFGVLWLIAIGGRLLFKREAMGFGDVKLLGAMGAFLGWKAVLFVLVVSSFVGSLVGLGLVAAKRKKMQSRIPYGPYLALAALLWILWGPTLWNAYVSLLTPAPLM